MLEIGEENLTRKHVIQQLVDGFLKLESSPGHSAIACGKHIGPGVVIGVDGIR
jgi:hypothetical protein